MPTILVAIDVLGGPDNETRERWLHENLPTPEINHVFEGHDIHVDSWWIAEDERYDRSDCDSAVFVKPGKQAEAVALLRSHGLAY